MARTAASATGSELGLPRTAATNCSGTRLGVMAERADRLDGGHPCLDGQPGVLGEPLEDRHDIGRRASRRPSRSPGPAARGC